MSTRLSAAGMLAMMTVVAGCGSTVAGVASPAAPTAQPGLTLPQRTKDLPLRGVDPCQLLTTAQLDELKENGRPQRVAESDQRDGPTCAFRVDASAPYYAYYLETITNADLQEWLTGTHKKSSMTKEPADVPGFPALKNYRGSERAQDCEVLVGVAGGQTLRVQTAPVSEGAFDQGQLCDMSTRVATMALRTLEAGK